jgi:hypothetical protein
LRTFAEYILSATVYAQLFRIPVWFDRVGFCSEIRPWS